MGLAWTAALLLTLAMSVAAEKPGVLSGKIMSPGPCLCRVVSMQAARALLTLFLQELCSTGLANTVVRLHTADGREFKSFVQPDGTFEFTDVPTGSHLLQAFQIGYFYPEV